MTKIRYRSASISENPELKAPKFNFSSYDGSGNVTYCNNEEIIDFVTDGDSLYVCVVPSVTPSHANLAEQEGFLKLVSRGPQGVRGPRGEDGDSAVAPRIDVNFDDDQLRVKVNGETKALSPSLTGPTWKPVLEDNILTWELTDDRYMPESIDLMNLRPIQERPLLLRTNSDNTKRSDESSGPANFIQWKYEGDEYWTNLISISELMNLALAGVSIWQNTEGKWHFGHREVVKATYASDKNGRKIISNVRLGDVLFDAGELPFEESGGSGPDYGVDIDLIYQKLAELELAMVKSVNHVNPDANGNVDVNLDGYATETWVDTNFQPKGDYVKSVRVNGTTYNPNQSTGVVDLGNISGGSADTSDCIKGITVNNGSTVYRPDSNTGIANIQVSGGGSVDTSDCVKSVTINGTTKTPVNGNVTFTIDVGGAGSFDIRLRDNRYLEKYNGTTWTVVLDLDSIGGGTGCSHCWTEEEIIALIDGRLSGVIPTDYLTQSDLDDYITRSELANYATEAWVINKINQALNGGLDIEYFRTFTLYTRSDSRTTAPNGPLDGVWEWNLTEGNILADSSQQSGWDNHPQNATPQAPYLWMASATFSSVTGHEVRPSNAATAWTKVCLTGEPGAAGADGYNGTDGADGNGIEFIYTLIRNMNDKPLVQRPVAPVGQGEDDIPNGWEDHPQGIGYYLPSEVTTTLSNLSNEETLFGIELASMRTYDGTSWSTYCEPFIWSMWGEDGIDGDGVEYIFFIADANSVEIDTTTGRVSLPVSTYYVPGTSPNFIPTTQPQVNDLGPSYQVPDWIQVADNNWTDNPSDVGTDQPFEFVSMRKYHDGTGWGPFCTPRLWSHFGGITVNPIETVYEYGSTLYSPYKCYAFYRANATDNTLHTDLSNYNVVYDFTVFGDQSNPNPTYSDLTTAQKNLFYEHPEVYAKTLNGNTVVPITWHDTVPSGDGQLWLITAHIGDEDDPLTDTGWTSPSRWGDKAGFNVEYCANEELGGLVYANPSLINNHNMTFNDYAGTDEERETLWEAAMLQAGYGVWSDTVEDPVYMATTVLVEGVWSNWTIAKIKGEQGEPGRQGGPGVDGNSIEFVYYRTKGAEPGIEVVNAVERGTYDPESAATRTKVNKDPYLDKFFPAVVITGEKTDGDYWHDHPKGVTEVYTHEWVATRTSAVQDTDRYWPNNFSVALWSKYGENGRDGDGIEYVFWGLTEQQNSQITCTWPTQSASNQENGGCNVDPTRHDSPANRSLGDREYLPAILINNVKVQAVDDNPGISNNAYVYASMRRYDGATRTWGEFGEIKLWNEQNNQVPDSIILDIRDDSHTIGVDENGRILDRYMKGTYSTDGMYLYRNLVLLNAGTVSIETPNQDVIVAELIPNAVQSNAYSKTNNTATLTQGNVTATITPSYVWKYEDSLHSTVELKVEFSKVSGQNPILNDSFDIKIKVQDSTGQYIGSDVMRLVPRQVDDDVTLLHVPGTQRTAEEGGLTYSDSEFNFYGWYGSSYTTLSLLEQTRFYFKYDNQANWTEFYIPSNNTNLVNLRNNVDGKQEGGYHFYFNRNGSVLSNASGAFYEIWLYNKDSLDNIHGQWTNWSMQAYVKPTAFTSTATTSDDYPIDELYFGIGFGGTILDEANVHIIYPGKNGLPGQPGEPGTNGSYKKELYRRGTENVAEGSWVATWSSTGATIATLTTAGWSATKPSTTSSYPHIWMTRADVTIGQEGTQVCVWETPTRITPVDGNVTHTYEYLAGTIMRTSEWSAGTTGTTKYWDGNTVVSTSGGVESISSNDEGIKYLDVVSVTTTTNGVTKTSWYKCITNHTKTSTSPASDSTNWAEFAIMGDAAFHNLLVENTAYIESLTSRQVVITDGSGANTQIVAGMASGTNIASASGNQTVGNVRIWAGTPTTTGDLRTAPFTVDNDGKLVSDDAEITGEIHAESGSIDGTLTIGANGELASSITESGGTVQTRVSAMELVNSYTDGSTYAYETKISEGKIKVANELGSYQLRAQLEPDELQFYSTDGSSGVSVYEAVTTPLVMNGSYAGSGFAFIKCIVQVTALPANPRSDTLYIVIS